MTEAEEATRAAEAALAILSYPTLEDGFNATVPLLRAGGVTRVAAIAWYSRLASSSPECGCNFCIGLYQLIDRYWPEDGV